MASALLGSCDAVAVEGWNVKEEVEKVTQLQSQSAGKCTSVNRDLNAEGPNLELRIGIFTDSMK